jgi:hypothetical protein
MNLTKKDWGLFFVTVLILFYFINVLSYYLILNKTGLSIYDREKYLKYKTSFYKNLDKGSVPHPFFGLSLESGASVQNDLSKEPLFEKISDIKDKNPIRVLVLGGSVASHLSNYGSGYDDNLLATSLNSYFKTERFVVFNAAFGGGKQPQQYFKYQYLDLLGFRPHIVINLDGFNEIALPLSENKTLGNPAIFPRSYSRLLHAASSDRSCASYSNTLLELETKLPITELLILILVQNCHYKIESDPVSKPWWSSAMGVDSATNYLSQSIAIWELSSNKLNEVLTARGIDYIHVLQPNQYLAGSKIFSNKEKEDFLNYDFYGKPISENYSKLSKKNLTTNNFRDQRYLFENTTETVYADNCCHFNQFGMRMIINDIIFSNAAIFRKHLN